MPGNSRAKGININYWYFENLSTENRLPHNK